MADDRQIAVSPYFSDISSDIDEFLYCETD